MYKNSWPDEDDHLSDILTKARSRTKLELSISIATPFSDGSSLFSTSRPDGPNFVSDGLSFPMTPLHLLRTHLKICVCPQPKAAVKKLAVDVAGTCKGIMESE